MVLPHANKLMRQAIQTPVKQQTSLKNTSIRHRFSQKRMTTTFSQMTSPLQVRYWCQVRLGVIMWYICDY